MNVLVFASRKGGSGKSTLAAHLATYIATPERKTLLVDCDPQGSLSFWHRIRGEENPALRHNPRDLAHTLKTAQSEGYEWVLIDTPPNKSPIVVEAIRHATLVIIPTRPSLFDIAAVQDTVAIARELRKPYAAVINGAPAKRAGGEAPIVADARGALSALKVPVWAGQITHRADFSMALAEGEGAEEFDPGSFAADELGRLWTAIDRSIKAVQSYKGRGTRAA
ncbi:ParA family protein [Microvirga sp. 17 mud 1-3]|uniref:ParA family protein n=1 Tax=Microvirga sp. 17 mud 1-3 TaxID=2082949 RepID=UPI000D6B1CE9|nr:ParA family protein [Microvirga sp. 17 mud 1-3]AWM87008.1 cobyrinic acid a,c-diamide synthase [Microvirga sp. 17 mud 1-3]